MTNFLLSILTYKWASWEVFIIASFSFIVGIIFWIWVMKSMPDDDDDEYSGEVATADDNHTKRIRND
jgi:hypothetical protein